MGFGDGGFDGGGGDYGGDFGFGDGGQDYGGQGYGQDPGAAWADAFHQGAGLGDQIAQHLAPIQEAVSNMQADRDAETLLASYPQLHDVAVQEAVIAQADQMAAQLGVPPQHARSAQFISLVMDALGGGAGGGQQGGYGQQGYDDPRQAIVEAAQTWPSRAFFRAIRS
jgi:hypothetical protein